jgi:ribosome-binding protein aMBF1 (putative translation factor)
MSSKAEKPTAAEPTATTPLPDDIAALFANTRQATPKELAALAKAADALRTDPAFLADYSKGLVVEDILRAMEEAGLNRNTLAAKLGKTRQYVGKILDEERRANFTIDTLAELSAALGVKLHVRMLPENEHMLFVRGLTVTTKVEPIAEFPKTQARLAAVFEDRFESSNITPFPGPRHERPRMSS